MAKRRSLLTAGLCGAFACSLAGAAAAGSLDPETNTDGFNPAASSYQIGEARRLDLIARQLDWNYRLTWAAGRPYCFGPIGHESLQTGPNTWTYRPIFPSDVEELPPPALKAPRATGPAIDGPRLPGPSEPEPPDAPPVAQPKRKPTAGPREF